MTLWKLGHCPLHALEPGVLGTPNVDLFSDLKPSGLVGWWSGSPCWGFCGGGNLFAPLADSEAITRYWRKSLWHVMVNLSVHLAKPRCPVVGSNTSLDVAMRCFLDVINA